MREAFTSKKFSTAAWEVIDNANLIIGQYQAQGYRLSLRQLYYQFVSRNWLANEEKSYKHLGSVIADARMAGHVDWAAIEDRGREVVWGSHWSDPAALVRAAAEQFRIDKWAGQRCFPFVMVEKQALEGVLEPVCEALDVRFAANKGYGSASFFYEVGRTLRWQCQMNRVPTVFYLGDHDPSGLDMSRDVRDRLSLFARSPIVVQRLALNIDQVRELDLPPNPAKLSDSRASAYVEEFGYDSWELDALEPYYLADLVTTAVEGIRDEDAWDEALARELEMREELEDFAREQTARWEEGG